MSSDGTLKVVLVGSFGVGKTNIISRFAHDKFDMYHESTIGSSYAMADLTFRGETFRFAIWDTAGSERYRALTPFYYRGAAAIIHVFAVDAKHSFDELDSIVEATEKHAPPGCIRILVGNKTDLEAEVDDAAAERFAAAHDAVYVKSSAFTGEGIHEIFEAIGPLLALLRRCLLSLCAARASDREIEEPEETPIEPTPVPLRLALPSSDETPTRRTKGCKC